MHIAIAPTSYNGDHAVMKEVISYDKVAGEDAVKRVVWLARVIWREHFTPIIGAEQVAYMLEKFQSHGAITSQIQAGYRYLLIRRHDKDIGYFAYRLDPHDGGVFLSKIYLLPAYRRHGLCRRTLHWLEQRYRPQGFKRIWLTVNKRNQAAIDAYEYCGFRKHGDTVQAIGGGFYMDDYRMEKPLSD